MDNIKTKRKFCNHDYQNAIPYGNVDHVCPKCKEFIDPGEWFLMTNFTFIDCTCEEEVKEKRTKKDRSNKSGKIAGDARKQLETRLKKSIVSKHNFLPNKII